MIVVDNLNIINIGSLTELMSLVTQLAEDLARFFYYNYVRIVLGLSKYCAQIPS